MEVHLAPEVEAKLNDLARRTNKPAGELLSEAVDYLVAYNAWFERKVKESLIAAENHTVPDEEVGAWLERRERR